MKYENISLFGQNFLVNKKQKNILHISSLEGTIVEKESQKEIVKRKIFKKWRKQESFAKAKQWAIIYIINILLRHSETIPNSRIWSTYKPGLSKRMGRKHSLPPPPSPMLAALSRSVSHLGLLLNLEGLPILLYV